MKKITKKALKVIILLFIFLSSALALYLNYIGEFDPVEMAVALKNENKRDQALEVIKFGLENKVGDQKALKDLQEEYEYGFIEKSKDLFWHGATKGDVFNLYSGIGCIAADLCIIGDVRDLTKEGYHLLAGKKIDYVVAALSGIGVGTTVLETTGGGVIVDAGVSVVKNVFKYATKVFRKIPDSLLKAIVAGKKVDSAAYKKIWVLFKETNLSIPNMTTILSKVKDVRYLDAAIDLTRRMKKGAVIFISKSGESGLRTYEAFKKFKLGGFFISSFKRNPKGVLGVTKWPRRIHYLKIVKKKGFVLPALIALSSLAMILAMLPPWVPVVTFIGSAGYFGWDFYRALKRRKKGTKHYKHLEQMIRDYFATKGIQVAIEPYASRGPDLEGTNGAKLIGEIKHSKELARDLPKKFWSDWNSEQSFGGKTTDYRLTHDLPKEAADLKGEVRGWIAVIYGQLNHYRKRGGLNEGWLVFEDHSRYQNSLNNALVFLAKSGKISDFAIAEYKDLGFAKISFS